MIKVKHNVLTNEEVQQLLNYYNTHGSNNLITKDAIRQRIKFDDPEFPKDLITRVVDSLLDDPYDIEYLAFLHSQKPFGIHTHGDINHTNLYNIVSIMLKISDDDQQNGTVFFDNHIGGKPAGFDKHPEHVWPPNIQHITDYSILPNYVDQDFPTEEYQKYLTHMSADTVHGLTFDEYVDWTPGTAMTFPRSQLHCTSSGNSNKISILVATLTK